MIKSFKVTNPRGELITLELMSPEKSGFIVKNIEGLGPPKSIINTGESLFEDGGFFNSARISQRNIVLDLKFLETSIETIEQIRNKSYRFFPMKTPLSIEVETDSRHGITTGYVESNEPNIFSKEEGTQISIICPEAFFFGGDFIETTFTGVVNLFEFPFENPSLSQSLIEFGDIFINTEANVFYTGDISTGVIILINFLGAVNNLTLHNISTGTNMVISSTKLIALTGSNFVAGDSVILSTIKGDKFITLIRNGVEINILNTVDIISDWFQLEKGDNVFTYTAASGLSNLQFSIFHRLVYEGL